MQGEVQLVFTTPEALLSNTTYRNMLLSSPYKEKLVWTRHIVSRFGRGAILAAIF